MLPLFRVCDACARNGVETRIGTADSPMVQVNVAVLGGALSYDAQLPRWAWKGFTRFDPRNRAQDDQQPGALESTAMRQELCVACAEAMLTASDAHEIQTQRQHRDEKRGEHARAEAAAAAAKAAALESRRSPVAP